MGINFFRRQVTLLQIDLVGASHDFTNPVTDPIMDFHNSSMAGNAFRFIIHNVFINHNSGCPVANNQHPQIEMECFLRAKRGENFFEITVTYENKLLWDTGVAAT